MHSQRCGSALKGVATSYVDQVTMMMSGSISFMSETYLCCFVTDTTTVQTNVSTCHKSRVMHACSIWR